MRKMFVFGKLEPDNIGTAYPIINGRKVFVDDSFVRAFGPYNHIEVADKPTPGFKKVKLVDVETYWEDSFYIFDVRTRGKLRRVSVCTKEMNKMVGINPEATPLYLKLGRLSRSKAVREYFND